MSVSRGSVYVGVYVCVARQCICGCVCMCREAVPANPKPNNAKHDKPESFKPSTRTPELGALEAWSARGKGLEAESKG
jgi:hypothetical protein